MPLLLASLLLKIGIPERLHKATLIVFAVFALISGFGIWLAVHDNGVRKNDRKGTALVVGQKTLKADRTANANDVGRQTEIRANDATTRKAIDDAAAKDPEKARAAAGPAANAAARSLRDRQTRTHPPAN